MKTIYVLIVLCLIQTLGLAATLHVPRDYPSIQSAIDYAVNGDRVQVAEGVYNESIDFKGKSIVVNGANSWGPAVLIGKFSTPAVKFQNFETQDSILEGFVIRESNEYTGAIYCSFASPCIRNNLITRNSNPGIYCEYGAPIIIQNVIYANARGIQCGKGASPEIIENKIDFNGGGVYCRESSSPLIIANQISRNATYYGGGVHCWKCAAPVIRNNRIVDNEANTQGGGIYCYSANAEITGNFIARNKTISSGWGGGVIIIGKAELANNIIAENSASKGGGVYMVSSSASLVNNTLVNNEAKKGGGLHVGNTDLTILNTILWGNHAHQQGPEIYIYGPEWSSTINISHSDVEGGKGDIFVGSGSFLNWGNGMIDSDPNFADSADLDYHLLYTSPCRNAGAPKGVHVPVEDFEGDPRVVQDVVDMGADEFNLHLYHTGKASPGGSVAIKVIGWPGTSTVALWCSAEVLKSPINSAYGLWYLAFPVYGPFVLPPIPGNGLLTFNGIWPNVPDLSMQALAGAELSNLWVIKAE